MKIKKYRRYLQEEQEYCDLRAVQRRRRHITQYIGDGSAVYPVVGLPQLDKESLLTIFDVPEKDRDNYFVKTLGRSGGYSASRTPTKRKDTSSGKEFRSSIPDEP